MHTNQLLSISHAYGRFSTSEDFQQPKRATTLTLKESETHEFDWSSKWRKLFCWDESLFLFGWIT